MFSLRRWFAPFMFGLFGVFLTSLGYDYSTWQFWIGTIFIIITLFCCSKETDSKYPSIPMFMAFAILSKSEEISFMLYVPSKEKSGIIP